MSGSLNISIGGPLMSKKTLCMTSADRWELNFLGLGEDGCFHYMLMASAMSLHTWHWRCLGKFQHVESFLLCACCHFEQNTPWHTELLCVQLVGDSDQNFETFPSHLYTGHGFSISSFCKINFWKCILLFEYCVYKVNCGCVYVFVYSLIAREWIYRFAPNLACLFLETRKRT
jgi:hypothetical protein